MNALQKAEATPGIPGEFQSLIKTDVMLKNGSQATVVTLLTNPILWEEIANGVANGIRKSDLATACKQSVYKMINGCLRQTVDFKLTEF